MECSHEPEWVTYNFILASQKILKEQYLISGFEDTILGVHILCHKRENFIQILHEGYGF